MNGVRAGERGLSSSCHIAETTSVKTRESSAARDAISRERPIERRSPPFSELTIRVITGDGFDETLLAP